MPPALRGGDHFAGLQQAFPDPLASAPQPTMDPFAAALTARYLGEADRAVLEVELVTDAGLLQALSEEDLRSVGIASLEERKKKKKMPQQAKAVHSVEFHATAQLATNWQDAGTWESFYLFFTFCAREQLLLSLREDEWYSIAPSPILDWASKIDPQSFWIFGSGKIDAEHQYGSTPLHRAAGANDLRLLRQVLATDPDLEVQDHRTGGTALHAAAAAGDAAAVDMLLRAGASVSAEDDINRKPMQVAQTDALRSRLL